MDICYICECELTKFLITPVLELPSGSFHQICEECADNNFPNWKED